MYQLLRDQFPGKRIVIAEFGWPSAGYNLRNAEPGRFEQAAVLRNFVVRADAIGMDYNIVEAIDKPWKFNEGGVGPYWGILDASRERSTTSSTTRCRHPPKRRWSCGSPRKTPRSSARSAITVRVSPREPRLRSSSPS